MLIYRALLFFFYFHAGSAWAVKCSADLRAGDSCHVTVMRLRPTQAAVGMREVDTIVKKYRALKRESAQKIEDPLKAKPLDAAIGPGGEF